ncbi:MAG: hypothetical protein ACOVP6_07740 [Lacibacter sp.]
MKTGVTILFIALLSILNPARAGAQDSVFSFEFYGDTIRLAMNPSMLIAIPETLQNEQVLAFYTQLDNSGFATIANELLEHKEKNKYDDWFYYQLIRKTAQTISPKSENYYRYTLYKWYLLSKSGYQTLLSYSKSKLLFYVASEETIYNLPIRIKGTRQFICLNYHDYGAVDFKNELFADIQISEQNQRKSFSYRVSQLPDFKQTDYKEKEIQFQYYENEYHFKVKLNPQIKTLFKNYPVVDYALQFNIPLSKETYGSLIPDLKKKVKGMKTRNGINFLMHFTRYAFLFEPDETAFGKEKRLSPEETLIYGQSDCEDRAALFFYLVKEIYNLPMIVLVYPKHVTIAVNLDKPIGKPILYNGKTYSICEPTPQKEDLPMGKLAPELEHESYIIAYGYAP